MRKFFKFYSLFLLLLLFACVSQKIPTSVWKEMEIEDDSICMAAGIEHEAKITRTTYWECRIRVIDQRILNYDTYGQELLTIGHLKSLRRSMIKRMKKENENMKVEIEITEDEKDHNRCILLGQKTNRTKDDFNYFKCRNEELKKRKDLTIQTKPLTNEEVFKSIEAENGASTKTIKIDNACVKYISNEKKYNNCIKKNDTKLSCKSMLIKNLKNRNIADEMYCLNRSVEKYPDSLALFSADTGANTFGPKIDKFDLIDLRDAEYNSCKVERKKKLAEYKFYLDSECEKQ